MTNPQWRAADVFKMLVNPVYAGIGPFDMFLEGEWVKDASYPAIISDDEWLKIQEGNVLESGAKAVLLGIRREVMYATGVKIDAFYHEKWLEDSIAKIKSGKMRAVFQEVLETLRPNKPLSTSERSRIVTLDTTSEIIEALRIDISVLQQISPDRFEDLILDRLIKWGYSTNKTGKINRKDGGIDIIATHPSGFELLGVQVKHHVSRNTRTASGDIRNLLGSIIGNRLQAGMLVTNTSFTADARWFANNQNHLIRLRDESDLKRWITGNFLDDLEWRELPSEIELAPGIKITVPKPR